MTIFAPHLDCRRSIDLQELVFLEWLCGAIVVLLLLLLDVVGCFDGVEILRDLWTKFTQITHSRGLLS